MAREISQDTVSESGISDTILLERVQKSDIDAFRILFDRYQPVVFRSALYRTRDQALAHDIVQETFLRIWDKRASLHVRVSFLALLFRISENLGRDHARKERTRERFRNAVPRPALSEQDDPEEALNLSLLQEKLESIINDQLPERCRAVFLLSRFEGKSNREIAVTLGISVRTVEHQVSLALRKIRKALR